MKTANVTMGRRPAQILSQRLRGASDWHGTFRSITIIGEPLLSTAGPIVHHGKESIPSRSILLVLSGIGVLASLAQPGYMVTWKISFLRTIGCLRLSRTTF